MTRLLIHRHYDCPTCKGRITPGCPGCAGQGGLMEPVDVTDILLQLADAAIGPEGEWAREGLKRLLIEGDDKTRGRLG